MSDPSAVPAHRLTLLSVQMSIGEMVLGLRRDSLIVRRLLITQVSQADVLRVSWTDHVTDPDPDRTAAGDNVAEIDRLPFFNWVRHAAETREPFVSGGTTWLWRDDLRLVVAGSEYAFPSTAVGRLRQLAGR
jgi:hypothetical protein